MSCQGKANEQADRPVVTCGGEVDIFMLMERTMSVFGIKAVRDSGEGGWGQSHSHCLRQPSTAASV